ncbi:hypothetical protein BCIN_02g04180 [Botrytis cinerea B05.10]|uniref:Uncharacterized protein n=1 Tax=Botryotinia fuckeliana (strain B05.10) TaxID=332648 RepID=A0A384J915_BOTFB|nr:hypothetical protein BCIN_02g04180 [Botrytis cinerea B05.10]ATZ47096.1 hypothetical protein BCIN_02g04180 [Botrytis cinerea B05.10]
MSLTPAQIEARELLAPIKFHQIFKLPATEKHAELKVSYAVAGPSDENAPTILFVVGMLGIRWLAFSFDHVAMEEGVRMIFIDRVQGNINLCEYVARLLKTPSFPI